MLKPSNFLYVPIKNGYWLRDSQGKPRMYKRVSSAIQNLTKKNSLISALFAVKI